MGRIKKRRLVALLLGDGDGVESDTIPGGGDDDEVFADNETVTADSELITADKT